MPARTLPIVTLCLVAALLAAPQAARANSFMLAPGAPTAAELSRRIASLEAELTGQLRGQALRDFQRESLARDADALRGGAGPRDSEVHAYARLQRRCEDLEARLRLLRGTAPGATPAAPAPR